MPAWLAPGGCVALEFFRHMGDERGPYASQVMDGACNWPEECRAPRPLKLPAQTRRTQLIRAAAPLFAGSGLHGTTTQALARAAGVTEPTLYLHFSNKEALFKAAVETNIEARLRTLENRLELVVHPAEPSGLIEQLAMVTVSVCVGPDTGALIVNWALLEAPEYAVELHRTEAGAIEALWEHKVKRSALPMQSMRRGLLPFIPQAVNVCLSYGLWLSSLRHTPATAKELISQFATAVAWMSCHGPDSIAASDDVRGRMDRAADGCYEEYFG